MLCATTELAEDLVEGPEFRSRKVEMQFVKMMIGNRVLDERYTRMLLARADLGLWDVIALDKVQKGKPLTDEEFKSLKSKKLVEGRRQNLFVSAEIAAITDNKESYIRNRAFDRDYYQELVIAYLKKYGEATRSRTRRRRLGCHRG